MASCYHYLCSHDDNSTTSQPHVSPICPTKLSPIIIIRHECLACQQKEKEYPRVNESPYSLTSI